jgi:Zn-dependent M28 family amino/carboxypeptidase
VFVNVNAVYNPHQRSENVIACMPGAVKDTYVVFTAHYDHLGMMGDKTVFPGASDNASGTAMLLYLAQYFSKHPQHYSILFIAFGAEEASLMGSEFYVWHPFVPLANVKFLTNIDIMGDASNGITVVNANNNPEAFGMLEKLNEKGKYVKEIMPRDNAANSDQYYFAKKHVPCFFIYSNGGSGFYHDIYDVRTALTLKHVPNVSRLLIDFTEKMQDLPPPSLPVGTVTPTDNVDAPKEMAAPAKEDKVPQKEEEPSPKPEDSPQDK